MKQKIPPKAAFLMNMSHEIRTPLNLILGSADLLAGTDLTPQQQKLVETLRNTGDHLLSLLSDILDAGEVEAMGLSCKDAPMELEKMILEVCEVIAVQCRMKKLKFDYLIDGRLPAKCIADSKRIKQVLLNLLNNAVKFTDHGRIELKFETSKNDLESMTLLTTISDTGIGIKPEDRERIFELFCQGESGLQRKYRGAGLGLSIAQAIVDHYGGNIEFQSQPGVGTEFRVMMKLALPMANEEKKIEEFKGKQILVISPGELERQTICHQLENAGATTASYFSGNGLLKAFSDEDYDLILLDVQSVDMSVFELLSHPEFSLPKDRIVALLPTLNRRNDIAELAQHGVSRYLYKPFSVEALMTSLQKKPEQRAAAVIAKETIDVLVVDDDPENRDLTRAYLASSPYRVAYAENGFVACELSQKTKFDLILMDIEMPGLNGYQTAKKIKTLRECRIVALSANAFNENVVEAKRLGFTGYLTKPIRKNELLQSISKCLVNDEFYDGSAAQENRSTENGISK